MISKKANEALLDAVLNSANGEEDISGATAEDLRKQAIRDKQARDSQRAFFANFSALFEEQLTPGNLKQFRAMQGHDANRIWDIVLASYVRARGQKAFVCINDKTLIGDEAFNDMFAPLVMRLEDLPAKLRTASPAKVAVSSYQLLKSSAAVYEPGKLAWISAADGSSADASGDGRTQYNVYSPHDITPLEPELDEVGDVSNVILDHIRYLIPNGRERRLLCDFLKWMVQRPDHKMKFALIIVGEKGTGKSWFSKLLTALMGKRNVLVLPKAITAAESAFNAEQRNRQAIFFDEIMPGGKTDLVPVIEPLIVGDDIWIHPKGVDRFPTPNRTNIMGVTNFQNALKIDRKARKWAIVQSTQEEFGEDENGNVETTEHVKYYNRLHATTPQEGNGPITDDVRRFYGWLLNDPVSADFDPDHAPTTDAKDDVAEATETTTESDVHGMVAAPSGTPMQYELVTVHDVLDELAVSEKDPHRKKAEADAAAAMFDAGCRKLEKIGQVYFGNRKRRLWVTRKKLLAKFAHMTGEEARDYYRAERVAKPQTLDNPADFEPGGDKRRSASARVH